MMRILLLSSVLVCFIALICVALCARAFSRLALRLLQ